MRYVIFFISWMITMHVTAQIPNPNRSYYSSTTKELDLSKVNGSPYLYEDLKAGKFTLNGVLTNGYLRYNIYTDEIELYNSKDKIAKALPKKDGYKVLIGNQNFVYFQMNLNENSGPARFYEILYPGKKYQLYKTYSSEFIPEKKAQSSMEQDIPAKFKTSSNYFIVIKDKFYETRLSKKNILRILKSDNLKSIINEHNLNLRNEEDLIILLSKTDKL